MNTNVDVTSETAAPFDNWMLLQDTKPQLDGEDSWSASSASSSTWFEPLETLLSSASSPSTDDQFSPYSASSMPVLIKQETMDDEDDNVLLSSASGIPATTPTATTTATTLSKPIKKGRTTRKRLTAYQKQAHNKIEKRYRININTKIARLQQIIPWVATEQTSFEVSGNGTNKNNSSTTNAPSTKLNKSMILEKAVDYILYLQNNERLHDMEVMSLRNELETLKAAKN
ncbi:similar to Saccharomyces cerevisiae YOR344C TYE7 Serine-rich protein that contains a basic-helix-loop-helix (bHLH) DNA binding motif [Maudiozyma saulgeensis]|uniref:Similar to Saccharomyces cerevisiae YOR344C TYE7 Serine-rich protein that contains a basic-helix-loop-helix (BHLH) DNA binding motif n=1 Tax=Maudiozyma saulgeensis TaxID=1789683 RepID=A0A1X7R4X9_9SACH|nr:similar to Saccharomyces cerevisiae YOR344C TYE7 Serine-rich protein that contains a basic-helix-loop-helix (bHLH) DNA binding motif [Kazachstania saulgeensis]